MRVKIWNDIVSLEKIDKVVNHFFQHPFALCLDKSFKHKKRIPIKDKTKSFFIRYQERMRNINRVFKRYTFAVGAVIFRMNDYFVPVGFYVRKAVFVFFCPHTYFMILFQSSLKRVRPLSVSMCRMSITPAKSASIKSGRVSISKSSSGGSNAGFFVSVDA